MLSDLPVVSVIITNYNYGSFIGVALESLRSQTYPNVEVIIVDDHSTDTSWQTITDLVGVGGPYQGIAAVQTPENGGQTAASAYGFHKSSGNYVIFLDADDVIYPQCIESHIYAHLSSRIVAGFSSVDYFTIVNDRIVTATSPTFSRFVASRKGSPSANFRPIDKSAPFLWFSYRAPPLEADDIYFIEAPYCDPWVWSPTSGICYRRRALALMLTGRLPADMRTQTDAYLMRPISAISGSILIDKPLMGYRVHGNNLFAGSEPLERLRAYDFDKESPHMEDRIRNSMSKLFGDLRTVATLFESPDYFCDAVRSVSLAWPVVASKTPGSTFLGEYIMSYQKDLYEVFPAEYVDKWIEDECGSREQDRVKRRRPFQRS